MLIRIADVLSVLCLGLLIWAMLLPAGQAYQYGDIKMELPIPIYALWIVALREPGRNDILRAGRAGGEAGHAEPGTPNEPVADRRWPASSSCSRC